MRYTPDKPTTDQGEVCPIAPRREVVYFSFPKDMQHTEAYAAVLSQIKRRHPHALILEPAVIWLDKNWRECYRQVLADVTHYYLPTRPDNTIGRGAFSEYLYFQERCIPTRAITPDGFLPIQKVFILSHDFDSWVFYASVITGADGEPAPGAA